MPYFFFNFLPNVPLCISVTKSSKLKNHIPLKAKILNVFQFFTASHTQEIRKDLEDSMQDIISERHSLAIPSFQIPLLLLPQLSQLSPNDTFNFPHHTFKASCQNQSAMMSALNHYVRS